MHTHKQRLKTFLLLLPVLHLAGGMIYYLLIRDMPPPRIQDTVEDVTIDFTVNQSAVLTLEGCISGQWTVRNAILVELNGERQERQNESQSYIYCNQAYLSPTLYVHLPSGRIAPYTLTVPVIYGNGTHLISLLMIFCMIVWKVGAFAAPHRRLIVLLIEVHLGIVIVYQLFTPLNIRAPWTWYSLPHTLLLSDLNNNFVESLLYLHAQPPLFNAYGGIFSMTFGADYPDAMYMFQVVLGLAMVILTYGILWQMTQRKTIAFGGALLLALNPALLLYEAIILYTIHSAFLIVLATFCLVFFTRHHRNAYLYLFVLCINLLILIRSVYHIILLIPVLLLVALLVRHHAKRVLVGCLLICLLSVGWYGKNLQVFGSFSASTWTGMSLWRIAHYDYTRAELEQLVDNGVLTEMVVTHSAFLAPDDYPGFEATINDTPVLSRNDLNHVNYPTIAQIYQENALRLIQHDPIRYIKTIFQAYGYYSCPSSQYSQIRSNIMNFPASHHAASTDLIHMQGLIRRINGYGDVPYRDGESACSNLYIVIPLLIVGYPAYGLYRCRVNRKKWLTQIGTESVIFFMWGMLTWTTLMTGLLEIPENMRFKFMVEVPLWILMIITAYRIFHLARQRIEQSINET